MSYNIFFMAICIVNRGGWLRMKKVLKSILTTIMIFTLSLTSVFADNSKLVIGIHKDENNLTPYTYVTGTPGLDVLNLVFDKLFILDEKNNVIPWMVDKEYKVSEDYKTYEFKLKENQKWHDGEPVTAEDIKFAFEYAGTQNQSKHKQISNKIENIEVKDELNFVITLKESNPEFINSDLTSFFIVPKHIYENEPKAEEVTATVGSGIYKLIEYKVGQYYKFEANEGYFKGDVNPKEIYMPIITDSTAMFNSIKSGELAASTMNLSPELLETFSSDKNIGILNGPGFASTLLQFNTQREHLNNKNVRKAMSYAIDMEEIIKTVNLGYAKLGNPGFFSKELDYANKNLNYEFSIEKAKELLEKEGYTLENGVYQNEKGKLSFELLVYSSSPARIRTAEMIKEYLGKVGIELKISSLDATTVDELVWPGFDVSKGRDFDMSMWGWSAGVQLVPNNIIGMGHSDYTKGNNNIGGYKSAEFDKVADELATTLDSTKRIELTEKLQEILAEDLPFITLSTSDVISIYNKNLGENWVMQDGIGIINKFSFINENSVVSGVSENSQANKSIYVGVGVVALGAIAAFRMLNKRKKA